MAFRTREQIARDEQEYRASRQLKPGIYPFQVKSATEGQSRKGAHMVSLELIVWDESNAKHTVRDWLGEWENGDRKFLGFCEATGQPETFDKGEIRAVDCQDTEGYVVLKIETSEQYGPQAQVSYYVPKGDEDALREKLAKKAGNAIPEKKFFKPEAVSVGAGVDPDLDLPF